ncbi:unnamed protein product [Amoebophrya sp. A25]|nr:unnamed protein product [Amoebophrya sp. A25]|eukprot:GSA25T00018576001.1
MFPPQKKASGSAAEQGSIFGFGEQTEEQTVFPPPTPALSIFGFGEQTEEPCGEPLPECEMQSPLQDHPGDDSESCAGEDGDDTTLAGEGEGDEHEQQ